MQTPIQISNRIRQIRTASPYLMARRQRMPFVGSKEDTSQGIYLCSAEEMPLISGLPLLKLAYQTGSGLFFIERGAYPQKLAVELVSKALNVPVKTASYKIAREPDLSLPVSYVLAELCQEFLSLQFPDNRNSSDKLVELLKSEPWNFLDEAKEAIFWHRMDQPRGLNKAVLEGRAMGIQREHFGGRDTPFREYLFLAMKKLFPYEVTKDVFRKYILEFYNLTRQYLHIKACSFEFVAEESLKQLSISIDAHFGRTIYCDDSMGSGNSFFMSHLFNRIFGETPFRFNFFTLNIDKNPLGASITTQDARGPEDEPTMFPFYYQRFERIHYESLLSKGMGQKNEYDKFAFAMERYLTNPPLPLQRFFAKVEKSFGLLTLRQQKDILFCFIDNHPINENIARVVGHNRLVNMIREQRNELMVPSALLELYGRSKDFHLSQQASRLLNLHNGFLDKLRAFRSFFESPQGYESSMHFLNESVGAPTLTTTPAFLNLAEFFYTYIKDSPLIFSGY